VTTGTVVVLPSEDSRYASVRGQLLNAGFAALSLTPSPGPALTEAARTCAAIRLAAPEPPLTIVAFAGSALLLPAIALAQRSAHRVVQEYVLVDPAIPPVSDGWPDAHVTVFSEADQRIARLRGWTIAPIGALADWQPARE